MTKESFAELIGTIIAEYLLENENKKESKNIESPVVSLTDKNILVCFDERDTDKIQEFYDFAESMPCTVDLNENVFIIKAEKEALYIFLYVLTTMYYCVVIS